MPTEGAERAERAEGDLRAGSARRGRKEAPEVLAGGLEGGEGMARAVGDALALLEGVLRSAPTGGAAKSVARTGVFG